MIDRRRFLQWMGTGIAGRCVVPDHLFAAPPPAIATGNPPSASSTQFDHYFLTILDGFIRNARRTSTDNSYAVCSYPEGTHLKTCDTPNGKTYVSVARMIPAIAEWLAGGRETRIVVDDEVVDLHDLTLTVFRCAFDPDHRDFWGYPPTDKPTQRTVESALVAIALQRMGQDFVAELSSVQRSNVQKWLASCTIIPERHNNHAWFTSLNQTARLVLSERFPEFKGDEAWLLEDLKALDALFPPVNEGWYSDRPDMPMYDYYNFWTFANFPLLWTRMIGDAYPEWREKFTSRVKIFLDTAPHFFAPDGSYPLYGRSLLYKWALLSPMTLGYAQNLWPHSPGVLRKLVRKNLEYHWNIGSYDETLGKLRETFSAGGTTAARERYIDNGHPYWSMLGCTFYSLPQDDSFWTEPESPLPVETGDYTLRFEGPKMLVTGNQRTGEVRWMHAASAPLRVHYRDKYIKFVSSSAFAPSLFDDPSRVPWDQALVFRDKRSGASASRTFGPGAASGELLKDDTAVRTTWRSALSDDGSGEGGMEFTIVSTIRLIGEFEFRRHEITAPPEAVGHVEVVEGSYGVGLQNPDDSLVDLQDRWMSVRSKRSNHCVTIWPVAGFSKMWTARTFDPAESTRINLVAPHVIVATMSGEFSGDKLTLVSLHYASPKPIAAAVMQEEAARIIRELQGHLD